MKIKKVSRGFNVCFEFYDDEGRLEHTTGEYHPEGHKVFYYMGKTYLNVGYNDKIYLLLEDGKTKSIPHISKYNYWESPIVKIKCIKPTKTLTKDKVYEAFFIPKTRYTSFWGVDYGHRWAVINDQGKYIEAAKNRFTQI